MHSYTTISSFKVYILPPIFSALQYTFLHHYSHAYLFTVYILTPIFPRLPVYSIHSYTNIPSFKYTFFHLYFPLYSRHSYTQHFLVYSIHSHTNISRFQTKIDKISHGGCSVGYSRVTCFLMCLFKRKIFCHLKLEIVLAIPSLFEWKYKNNSAAQRLTLVASKNENVVTLQFTSTLERILISGEKSLTLIEFESQYMLI